jgi:ureidoacrylate peracid hydrolase
MADPRSRVVAVDARPEPIRIDLSKSAIVVVDMQNDFGAPGGMFDRAGIDITPIRRIVEPTVRVLTAARHAGLPVVYLKQEHRPDLTDAGDAGSPHRIKHRPLSLGEPVRAPDGTEGRILVKDTWNTAILPELAPREGDVVISKHRYSGFYETVLDEKLRELGVVSLIFAGATTSVCVESTLRDAMYRDYRCVLLGDCTAEPIGLELPRSNHEASLLTIELLFGWVSSSDQFVTALSC